MIPQRLLATDLDGTFVGDDAATLTLWQELDSAGITVVFATGRHVPSIDALCEELGTDRRAAGLVTMVGTEIWLRVGGRYVLDVDWTRFIAQKWERSAVDSVVAETVDAVPQPDEWQSPLKSSWFFASGDDLDCDHLAERLAAAGVEAKVIASAGQFLDILPRRSGKGEAVRYLARHWDVSESDVVTAGDTGNDLDMMRPELGFHSIVVANAEPELRELRGSRIYHATAPYAAGIAEGLRRLGWLDGDTTS